MRFHHNQHASNNGGNNQNIRSGHHGHSQHFAVNQQSGAVNNAQQHQNPFYMPTVTNMNHHTSNQNSNMQMHEQPSGTVCRSVILEKFR